MTGTDMDKQTAFNTAFRYLQNRISLFLALPIRSLDQLALQKKLDAIGKAAPANSSSA